MTPDSLRYFLPAYFVVLIALAFFWRGYRVWRSTGHNPYKLGAGDSAHDYIGRLFLVLAGAGAGMLALLLFYPAAYPYLLPITWLVWPPLTWAGLALLIAGLIWMLVAQETMGGSWRIGVDTEVRTDLVRHGLYTLSRNPIFLGMRAILFGLVLVLPNALSLIIFLLAEVLIQIQVRLEEQHLDQLHGAAYRAYRASTPRWI